MLCGVYGVLFLTSSSKAKKMKWGNIPKLVTVDTDADMERAAG